MSENKLTNEEIARVFAIYWGCEIIGVESGGVAPNTYVDSRAKYLMSCGKVKLLLTPLSAITDEHAIEASFIFNNDGRFKKCSMKRAAEYKKYVEEYCTDYNNFYVKMYLIQQGYAVPLFFGVNHWANGKDAIQLEIAIDRTKI